jgi:hypothetical protein
MVPASFGRLGDTRVAASNPRIHLHRRLKLQGALVLALRLHHNKLGRWDVQALAFRIQLLIGRLETDQRRALSKHKAEQSKHMS